MWVISSLFIHQIWHINIMAMTLHSKASKIFEMILTIFLLQCLRCVSDPQQSPYIERGECHKQCSCLGEARVTNHLQIGHCWHSLQWRKEMFYLTMHSTHFIYGYMASDIWLRTIMIVRKETRCHHIGYSFRLTARVLLYAPSHRQDSTYHSLCWLEREIAQWVHPMKDRSDDPSHHEQTLLPRSYISLHTLQWLLNTNKLCTLHIHWQICESIGNINTTLFSFLFCSSRGGLNIVNTISFLMMDTQY